MNRAEVTAHLVALLRERVLDPEAAVKAAWEAGYKQADESYAMRQMQNNSQLQALGQQGSMANRYR